MTCIDRRGVVCSGRARPTEGHGDCRVSTSTGSRLPLLLLSGLLLLFASACQSSVQRAADLAQQAQALSDAGDNSGALDAINKAIALRDDNADYFMLLGAVELRANDPASAFKAFSRALELDATNVAALSYVANLGLQLGQISDATDAADRLLALNPNSTVGLQVKGLAALFADRPDDAERYAARILAISPSDEAGTIVRARILADAGKFDDALALIDKDMQVTGPTPALLITKLNLYRVLKQPVQMEATFQQLVPVLKDPPNQFKLDEINLLYKMGKIEAARQRVQAFLANGSNDANDYRTLQRIWFEFDPVPFDRKTIMEARHWPDPLAVLAVGRFLLWNDSAQVADDLFFRVRPVIRPIALAIHARASLALGRRAMAGEIDDQILKRDKDDVDALLLHAQFEQQAGHNNLAIEAVQKALDDDPFDPEAYAILAGLQRATGANWAAMQVLEDGLKQLPQNFLLIEKYTQILHESGDKTRAVSVARTFARNLPSSVKAWTIMAAQCKWADDAACADEAEQGREAAQTAYRIDDPPGAPIDHGLLSKF